MTKPETKTGETRTGRPPQEDMQAAYQIHTLAQMLYGQMAVTHPWTTFGHPVVGIPQQTFEYASPVPHWGGSWGTPPWTAPVSHHPFFAPYPAPFPMTGFERFPR